MDKFNQIAYSASGGIEKFDVLQQLRAKFPEITIKAFDSADQLIYRNLEENGAKIKFVQSPKSTETLELIAFLEEQLSDCDVFFSADTKETQVLRTIIETEPQRYPNITRCFGYMFQPNVQSFDFDHKQEVYDELMLSNLSFVAPQAEWNPSGESFEDMLAWLMSAHYKSLDEGIAIKPVSSNGSRGLRIAVPKLTDEFKATTRSPYFLEFSQAKSYFEGVNENFVVQPFFSGKSYDVQCYYSKKFKKNFVCPVIPLNDRWGQVKECIIEEVPEITEIANKIQEVFGINGFYNFEISTDSNGNLFLVEINPRIATPINLAMRGGRDYLHQVLFEHGLVSYSPEISTKPVYGKVYFKTYTTVL